MKVIVSIGSAVPGQARILPGLGLRVANGYGHYELDGQEVELLVRYGVDVRVVDPVDADPVGAETGEWAEFVGSLTDAQLQQLKVRLALSAPKAPEKLRLHLLGNPQDIAECRKALDMIA